ncbi:unnamed protein product [Timema podura]|uniref:Uncharacterized protein n=1 Tax=Timema podura TaxID=61482 RepID=A0ABN7PCD9_TIMPD|nr:unnamed protein product [Timema podura]
MGKVEEEAYAEVEAKEEEDEGEVQVVTSSLRTMLNIEKQRCHLFSVIKAVVASNWCFFLQHSRKVTVV